MILILISVCAIICALFEDDIETAKFMIFICTLLMLLVELIGDEE